MPDMRQTFGEKFGNPPQQKTQLEEILVKVEKNLPNFIIEVIQE